MTSAAVIAGALVVYGMFAGRDETLETSAVDEARGYYLTAASLTEYGPDGAPRIVLHADSIEQQLADQSVDLSDLDLDYRTKDFGVWHVTALSGHMPADRQSIELSGSVKITGEQSGKDATIRTERVSYDIDRGIVQTRDPVTVNFGSHELQARGLRAELNAGTLQLESNVNGRFVP